MADLRAVKPGEKKPASKKPLSIIEAAEANDERALLVALRKKLAQTVQDSATPARDQASLSIRLLQINRDIQALDSRDGGDEIGKAASTPDADLDADAI